MANPTKGEPIIDTYGQNGSHGYLVTNGNTSNYQVGTPGVELYTLIICVSLMFAFGILGTLSNLALLLSTKCKRNIRSLEFGLPYCMATANLLLCLLWVPIEVIRLSLNFNGHGLHHIVCYTEIVLFYFCVGMIVFLNIFITMYRLLAFLGVKVVQTIFATMGILLSIGLSGLLASTVVFEYNKTRDYRICTQSWMLYSSHRTRTHLATMLANMVWVVALTAMSILMSITMVKQRKQINPKPPIKKPVQIMEPEPCTKTSSKIIKKTSDSYVDCQEKEDSRITDKDGSSCKVQFSEPSSSKEKIEKSSSKNLSFTELSKQFFFGKDCRNRVEKPDNDNDSDLDDEEYEAKMKLKLQKSLSGRRHTVANIGLGESLFGSKREGFGSRSTSPNPHNYQYVRKWSVDITALQDQLENPKSSTASDANLFPDLNKLQNTQTSDNRLSECKIVEEKHEEENQHDKIEEIEDTHVSQELLPAISDNEDVVANGNNPSNKPDSHSNLNREIDIKDKIEEVEEEEEEEEVVEIGATADDEDQEEDEDDKDDELLGVLQGKDKKVKIREMQVNTVSLLLTLVVLVCILPFAIIQLLQSLMIVSVNRNVSAIMAAVVLIQTPIHTFMIAWMEKKIWQALRKLRLKLTHWTCVCYCNIGKGRQCFGRPHYNGKCTTAL